MHTTPDLELLRSVGSGQVWAIDPDRLEAVLGLATLRGAQAGPERRGVLAPRAPLVTGGVAVLPMHGILVHRASPLANPLGAVTSTEAVGRSLDDLLSHGTETIVLEVDSPGGEYDGVPELADKVFHARSRARIIAVADSLATAGAYVVAAAAGELVVSPSAVVGGLGVFTMHDDFSAMFERVGLTRTVVRAPASKAEGAGNLPLSAAARTALRATVQTVYATLVESVARGRAVTPARVRDGFGQGRTVMSERAVREGMADRVATLESVVRAYQRSAPPLGRNAFRAPAESPPLDADAPGAWIRCDADDAPDPFAVEWDRFYRPRDGGNAAVLRRRLELETD